MQDQVTYLPIIMPDSNEGLVPSKKRWTRIRRILPFLISAIQTRFETWWKRRARCARKGSEARRNRRGKQSEPSMRQNGTTSKRNKTPTEKNMKTSSKI